MHHLPIRENPNCLNCGNTVEERYCTHCGQENVESRQSAGHLFFHFFEDLTHYEGKFWSSMRLLAFRPGQLTREYLDGRRNSYLLPVRMYIFVSFISFVILGFLPSTDEVTPGSTPGYPAGFGPLNSNDFGLQFEDGGTIYLLTPREYRSLAHYDSVKKALPENERPDIYDDFFNERMIELSKFTPLENGDRFIASIGKSIPKALFIVMPLFALVIYFFHSRKRWLYFDHGIFTLHFFSFTLLFITTLSIFRVIAFAINETIYDIFMFALAIGITFGLPLYFIVAHRCMYGEKWAISIVKSLLIYAINLSIITFVGLIIMIITLFSI